MSLTPLPTPRECVTAVDHRYHDHCGVYIHAATNPEIRALLEENPRLPKILKAIDILGGTERERAFEAVLGVSTDSTARTPGSHRGNAFYWLPEGTNEEDMEALGRLVQTLSSVMVTAERIGDWRQASPAALEIIE